MDRERPWSIRIGLSGLRRLRFVHARHNGSGQQDAHPRASDAPEMPDAYAPLRYLVGSTGTDPLRISKCSCGEETLPVWPA